MKEIMVSFSMPQAGAYFGGVASMINSYRESTSLFIQQNCDMHFFDFHGRVSKKIHLFPLKKIVYGVEQIKSIVPQLKKENIEIFHIHTSRNSLFFKDIFLGAYVKRRTKAKVVLSIHVGDIDTVFEKITPFKSRLLHCMNHNFDKIIFLSNEMCKQFITAGLDSSRCAVLYNFYNMPPIDGQNKLRRTAKMHLIYVGAIHREKGVLELLSALCNLEDLDFHLDLCGQLTDQSIDSEFNRMVKQLGNKITLCGYVSGTQKTALYERADILLLPSYHEGLPLVILEGLSQGCALISTKVGATPEILNQDNVIWVDLKNSESIENAVSKLYSDSDLLQHMQIKNKLLGAAFGLDEHISRLCKIYREM